MKPIAITEMNGIPIINLDGEVDLYSTDQITTAIRKLVGEEKRNMIIDLKQVPYVDSSGLGSFISNMRFLKDQDGDLKFIHPTEKVINLLRLTKLNTILEIYDSAEEALQKFAEPAAAHSDMR